jgi:hypothetical protein
MVLLTFINQIYQKLKKNDRTGEADVAKAVVRSHFQGWRGGWLTERGAR